MPRSCITNDTVKDDVANVVAISYVRIDCSTKDSTTVCTKRIACVYFKIIITTHIIERFARPNIGQRIPHRLISSCHYSSCIVAVVNLGSIGLWRIFCVWPHNTACFVSPRMNFASIVWGIDICVSGNTYKTNNAACTTIFAQIILHSTSWRSSLANCIYISCVSAVHNFSKARCSTDDSTYVEWAHNIACITARFKGHYRGSAECVLIFRVADTITIDDVANDATNTISIAFVFINCYVSKIDTSDERVCVRKIFCSCAKYATDTMTGATIAGHGDVACAVLKCKIAPSDADKTTAVIFKTTHCAFNCQILEGCIWCMGEHTDFIAFAQWSSIEIDRNSISVTIKCSSKMFAHDLSARYDCIYVASQVSMIYYNVVCCKFDILIKSVLSTRYCIWSYFWSKSIPVCLWGYDTRCNRGIFCEIETYWPWGVSIVWRCGIMSAVITVRNDVLARVTVGCAGKRWHICLVQILIFARTTERYVFRFPCSFTWIICDTAKSYASLCNDKAVVWRVQTDEQVVQSAIVCGIFEGICISDFIATAIVEHHLHLGCKIGYCARRRQ